MARFMTAASPKPKLAGDHTEERPKCGGGDFFPPGALCLGLPFRCSIWPAAETLVLLSPKAGALPPSSRSVEGEQWPGLPVLPEGGRW